MANDINQIAHLVAREATRAKNPNAVALGHLGGLKGGPARAATLSKEQRQEIGRKAAKARWNKKK